MLKEKLAVLELALAGQDAATFPVQDALRHLMDINFALDEVLIVAITDVRGNITFANAKFCHISQYSLSELLGQNHRIVNSGQHSQTFFRDMWRTIANRQIWRGEIKNRAKDGTFYWMDTTIVPSLDAHGRPYQYVSFRHDITARKLEEERFERLIFTMPDLVIFKSDTGRWLKANEATVARFGLYAVDTAGLCDQEIAQRAERDGPLLVRLGATDDAAWEQDGAEHRELEYQSEQGQRIYYDVTKVPVFHADGTRSGLITICKDITEQKRADEFLRRADRITAVGQMASGLAHEIRNPLAAIKWSLQVLKAEHGVVGVQVDAMLSELDRVDGIVGDLLVLAKPHERQFQSIDLASLLQTVVTLMANQARRYAVRLVLTAAPDIPSLRCEPNQLKQVCVNLIKNAIEAMPQGGEVRIEAELAAQGMVLIRFTDGGQGIPDDLLARLGEPFFTTKENGTGLGLMVCHKIISDHQGRLNIRSTPGKGTVMEVVLPRSGPS